MEQDMTDDDFLTDDAKLIRVLMREQLAHTASYVAEAAGVDAAYAERALARMADSDTDPLYPIIRRRDLGPDVYEAVEDSARKGA
jgi:hypothetical protein